ncbi:MAG: DUF975 family protein [Lachnospiraceae bacterium]|nr:DUF975 family protein [Lachnospiraceae bacterium]
MAKRTWSIKEAKRKGFASIWRNLLFSVAIVLITEIVDSLGTGIHFEVTAEDLEHAEAFMRSVLTWAYLGRVLAILGINLIVRIFVGNIASVGKNRFFLINRTGENAGLDNIFFGFRDQNYLPIFKAGVRRAAEVILWGLLLIVPGVIKYLEHSMIPYILAEDPKRDTNEVFELSKILTEGEKWNLFVFHLSFIGWEILCGLAGVFGSVGELLLNPYKAASEAEVYEMLKAKKQVTIA